MNDGKSLLTPSNAQTVMQSLAAGQGEAGFSERQLGEVLKEVERMKLMGGLYDLVVAGEMEIRIEDGEITYLTRPGAPILQDDAVAP